MILSKAAKEKIISKEEANKLWNEMLKKGIELPEDSFSDYYLKLYESDCEKFLNRNCL